MTDTVVSGGVESQRAALHATIDRLAPQGSDNDLHCAGIMGFNPLCTVTQWRLAIETGTDHQLRQMTTALGAIKDQIVQRTRRDAALADVDRRRQESQQPLTENDVEYQTVRQIEADARRAAEYRASTPGKLDELIDINRRILEALEKGVRV